MANLTLEALVHDFAFGMSLADAKRPVHRSARSGRIYSPGLGPCDEALTIRLVMQELSIARANRYSHYVLGAKYPKSSGKCDICIGAEWAVEVKMLRFLGDNGKVNDNILMHILSPYPAHRSALTDCDKLRNSHFGCRKAILIYGYEDTAWPLEPAIGAFERLAQLARRNRVQKEVTGLIHQIHNRAVVFGWELTGAK